MPAIDQMAINSWSNIATETQKANRFPTRHSQYAFYNQAVKSFARHGWIGLLLVAVCWPLDWVLPGVRTSYLFFPLWVGYILVMDAIVVRRSGTSLMTRSRKEFAALFLISIPAWWLFEGLNERTHNWVYLGRERFSDITYFILSSVCFSTVMPAVFESAEWMATAGWLRNWNRGPRVPDGWTTRWGCFAAGVAMISLTLLWPRIFYPLVWGGVFLVLDPLNDWLGRPSLLRRTMAGDWRAVISLALGALMCGFFWEMWNYFSFPKWKYHTPGVNFLHLFEMPLPGYLGYIPFSWELFALANFLRPRALRLGL
jgi:hypothetical protein